MRRTGRLPRSGAVLTAVIGIAVLIGCGGDGDGSSPDGSAGLPEPEQPIGEQIPIFEQAASARDCKDALRVVHRVLLPDPEHLQSKRNCDAALYALRRLEDFQAGDSEEFGTAAVVDGVTTGETGLVWALDEDGGFKWIGSLSRRRQVGTKPAHASQLKRTAEAFIQAVRAGDCKAAFDAVGLQGRLSYGDEATFCRKFEDTFTATGQSLGSRLRRDPDTHLIAMGGTRDWAFYGLATDPAGYRTVVVTRSTKQGGPRVFDVVPTER